MLPSNASLAVQTAPAGLSPSKRWLKAIELTAKLDAQPNRLLADCVHEAAGTSPDAPALLSDAQSYTYAQLATRIARWSRWALAQGISKGDRVALAMGSRPDYVACWAGITAIGGVVALINTQLKGEGLRHAIAVSEANHVITDAAHSRAMKDALPESDAPFLHVAEEAAFEAVFSALSGEPLDSSERRDVTLRDPALLIYTSGTTGLPKAAHVSHHRIMSWGHWFAGLTGAEPDDRLFNCLPVHHSVGGVVAIASMMVAGGSTVLAPKFSASGFWRDVVRWECTLFQYIGELCRYLVNAPETIDEHRHTLRMACGNGLRGDVWQAFQQRFNVPQILEFYAATEGNFSLFNVEGKPGAIGRIPPFLKHRFPAAIVKFDSDLGRPKRGDDGLCIRAERGEAGEAIGRISGESGGRFEGYTSADESAKKVLRDVFEKGDAWYRTGDLMRIDEAGYYYFVDRIGDTFRWKGENVATAEVATAITAVPGVVDATVYGVTVPGTDGRAGMAAIHAGEAFDMDALAVHLADALPAYARPVFIRLQGALELTETFKQKRTDLVAQGFEPTASDDPVFVLDGGRYVALASDLHAEIVSGKRRL
ncbi:long-chain-acyl-CoA synthetase [Tepidamorphus sp. 3E244]|uniref:long-chain-acyl-CoA synthetase n=1 Tax=Tepidamorphus sp. 3E244 TaxID=3385498 RepID=UPI0038FC7199